MLDDHENVEHVEADRGDREEVDCPGIRQVIAKERQPGLGFSSTSGRLDHVLPYRVRTGWIQTEELQVAMDSFGAPQDVFSAESADEELHFSVDRRPSPLATRLPAPPESEHPLVPAGDGVRLHQTGTRTPAVPELREHSPEESEGRVELGTRLLVLLNPLLTDRELALERDELEANGRSAPKERRDERDRRAEKLSEWKEALGEATEYSLGSFHASRIARAFGSGQPM